MRELLRDIRRRNKRQASRRYPNLVKNIQSDGTVWVNLHDLIEGLRIQGFNDVADSLERWDANA